MKARKAQLFFLMIGLTGIGFGMSAVAGPGKTVPFERKVHVKTETKDKGVFDSRPVSKTVYDRPEFRGARKDPNFRNTTSIGRGADFEKLPKGKQRTRRVIGEWP